MKTRSWFLATVKHKKCFIEKLRGRDLQTTIFNEMRHKESVQAIRIQHGIQHGRMPSQNQCPTLLFWRVTI